MTSVHLVAFSSSVEGAMIAAGAPYGCYAQPACYYTWYYYEWGTESTKGKFPDVMPNLTFNSTALAKNLYVRYKQNLIDDPSNLKDIPVLLFCGQNDDLMPIMENARQFYSELVSPANLHVAFDTQAGHVWVVDNNTKGGAASCECGAGEGWTPDGDDGDVDSSTTPCGNSENCGYDLTKDMLKNVFGSSLRPSVAMRQEGLRWIRQWDHYPKGLTAFPTPQDSPLLEWAPVYVPEACDGPTQVASCRLHIDYHGCTNAPKEDTMDGWLVRLAWQNNIDINSYAESNKMVVLYPQTFMCWQSEPAGDGGFPSYNAHGFDPLFDTKLGASLKTVASMLGAIAEGTARLQKQLPPKPRGMV